MTELAVSVANIMLSAANPTEARQLAGVVLRQIVEHNWSTEVEDFEEPMVPEEVSLMAVLRLRADCVLVAR